LSLAVAAVVKLAVAAEAAVLEVTGLQLDWPSLPDLQLQ